MDLTFVPLIEAIVEHIPSVRGIPYASAMCGAKMVMPGARMHDEALFELMESEQEKDHKLTTITD